MGEKPLAWGLVAVTVVNLLVITVGRPLRQKATAARQSVTLEGKQRALGGLNLRHWEGPRCF